MKHTALWCGVLLLVLFCATRLPALEALPLHNDEGLHLRRAVEVWDLHPFFDISDGKIINHWPIAALYPQNAPVFVGRIPTILVSLLGLAAGYALLVHVVGFGAALLGAVFWITSAYLFFFERIAFSDSQAGALIVIAVYFAVRLRKTGTLGDAILTGLAFSAAVLFKFTAAPYVLTILILLDWRDLRRSARHLLVMAIVGAVCFAVPLAYLLLTGRDFFGIALEWVAGGGGGDTTFAQNLMRFGEQLFGFGVPASILALMLLGGLIGALLIPKLGWRLCLAWLAPLLIILILGNDIQPRHYVVALPLAAILAGAGWGYWGSADKLPMRLTATPLRVGGGVFALVLLLAFLPFALTAYRDPAALPLPDLVRRAHITEFSAGYGLREAVWDFPNKILPAGTPVISSMYPDSCRRANFYAVNGLTMLCGDAPMQAAVEAALSEHGAVYVLVENAGVIGLAPSEIDGRATQIAAYPRPDETEATASVVLWRFER